MNSKFRRQVTANIRRTGRTLLGIFDPEGVIPPFVYTIGNWCENLPELICLNIRMEEASFLNTASELQRKRGYAFTDNEVISLGAGAGFPVKFLDVSNTFTRDEYTIQAGQYWHTEDYEVRQLLIPDKTGRFPGDPLCAEPYAGQLQLKQVSDVIRH